jgi:hypothetical protein
MMLKATRRRFMALVAPVIASTSLAAKAAADEAIGAAAGLAATNGLRAAGPAFGINAQQEPGEAGSAALAWENRVIGTSDYFRVVGVPDFVKEIHRANAKYVHGLDPDIACKKSWSMSVKIMTQRQRNYDQSIAVMFRQDWFVKERAALSRILGFKYVD